MQNKIKAKKELIEFLQALFAIIKPHGYTKIWPTSDTCLCCLKIKGAREVYLKTLELKERFEFLKGTIPYPGSFNSICNIIKEQAEFNCAENEEFNGIGIDENNEINFYFRSIAQEAEVEIV